MNIVILDGYSVNPGDLSWDAFRAFGGLTVYDRTPPEKVIERIGGAEAILLNKVQITQALIDACPQLKYIGELATGYNNIDITAAKARKITVCNIPNYSTMSVAQLVFAFILEICHHVGAHDAAVHSGRWSSCQDFTFWDYPLMELDGKTLGIIGYGRIGQAVAKIARAFGMNVAAYNPRPKAEDNARLVPLDELLSSSDIITLHCPLFPETQGLINKAAIAKMKDGVILINASRGPIINEEDTAAALNSGKIYAAGLDVASVEPIRAENPLLTAKNCFITPHIAWAPVEARKRLVNIALNNLKGFIEGKPVNVVN